jgi:hypothetical protein
MQAFFMSIRLASQNERRDARLLLACRKRFVGVEGSDGDDEARRVVAIGSPQEA